MEEEGTFFEFGKTLKKIEKTEEGI